MNPTAVAGGLPGAARPRGARARAVVYALVLPWVVTSLWKTPYDVAVYCSGVLVVAAIASGLARGAPGLLATRGFYLADVVLFNVVLALVGLEAGARIYLAVGDPPPWLELRPDVVRYRLDPTHEFLGMHPNSGGFHDLEFQAARTPGVTRVVALGDSFSVGIVPYAQNYLTLVEASLAPRIEIYNMGVCATEVPQYLQVLEHEGLALAPHAVLVGFYVGNDIHPAESGAWSVVESRLFHTLEILDIVLRNGAAFRRSPDLSGLYRKEPDGTVTELPSMPEEIYYQSQWKHLQRLFGPPTTSHMQRAWRDTEYALDRLIERTREQGLPLLATIAPDELQVDADLVRETARRYGADPAHFDFDYPRRRVRAFLEQRGVPVLDLTEALVEAQREAPTYHLRAMHWNRHGNAAVARVLAPWLEAQLARLLPGSRARAAPPEPRAQAQCRLLTGWG